MDPAVVRRHHLPPRGRARRDRDRALAPVAAPAPQRRGPPPTRPRPRSDAGAATGRPRRPRPSRVVEPSPSRRARDRSSTRPWPSRSSTSSRSPPRLRDRLGRTRAAFVRSLAAVRGRGSIDDDDVGRARGDAAARRRRRADHASGCSTACAQRARDQRIGRRRRARATRCATSWSRCSRRPATATLAATDGRAERVDVRGGERRREDHDHRQGRAARDRRRPHASCSPRPTRSAPRPPSSSRTGPSGRRRDRAAARRAPIPGRSCSTP